MKQHIKTVYEDRRLGNPTQLQARTLERLNAAMVGLAITGVLKAMSKQMCYLIARDGTVTFKARKGRIS
jgi:hypothetical protein